MANISRIGTTIKTFAWKPMQRFVERPRLVNISLEGIHYNPANNVFIDNSALAQLDRIDCFGASSMISSSFCQVKKMTKSILKPFSKKQVTKVKEEAQQYFDEIITKQIPTIHKPNISIETNVMAQGCCHPVFGGTIVVDDAIITKDMYKLIDRKTGKCIEDPISLWQITGSHKLMEDKIKELGLKNVDILPLSQEERVKLLKSTIAHEYFHNIQFINMILHENIGFDKYITPSIETICREMRASGQEITQKEKNQIYECAKKMWQDVIQHKDKIPSNSELGKVTIQQFKDLVRAQSNTDLSRTMEIYRSLSTEIGENGAYTLERAFAEKNNLLL